MFFLLISGIHEEAGLWPLAIGRLTSVAIAGSFALLRGLPPIVPRIALPLALAAGALDVTANVTFLLATQRGLVSVVAVIASLYPAGTVLLAMGVEGERLSAAQGVGLAAAARRASRADRRVSDDVAPPSTGVPSASSEPDPRRLPCLVRTSSPEPAPRSGS